MSVEKKTNTSNETSENSLNARLVSLTILDIVLRQKQMLDYAFENTRDFSDLSPQDKAFAHMLVMTTLRRVGQIDDLISKAEDNPSQKDILLSNILRLGITQILFMNVPDYAAVNTSVELADKKGARHYKGFINAILRRVGREGKNWLQKQDPVRFNTPEWLLKTWITDYGMGEAAKIAQANMAEPPLDISIRNPQEWNFWSNTLKATQVGRGSLRCTVKGSITELQGFNEGAWWVQSAASALPAYLFGDLTNRTVYDLCAAPGGKTMQLASQGAQVTAIDRSASRLKRLKSNAERVNLADNISVLAIDATTWIPNQPAEMILLDVPCSATGTIRKHPELPYLKSPKDIERLIDLQRRLLEHAFKNLAVGGILIYCTCSLQKDEGEHLISKFVNDTEPAKRVPIQSKETGTLTECITQDGDIRILPYHQAALGGMDGFYISRLTKTA